MDSKTGDIRRRNRVLILDNAEREFAIYGYRGTSIRAIAERSGLPKSNVHYYFSSKSNLYGEVLKRIVKDWNSGLSEVVDDACPAEVLERFIRMKVKLSFEMPHRSKLFATEILAGAPYLENHIHSEMKVFIAEKVAVFENWIRRGTMDVVDPYHLIFLIWASTQHYADFDTEVLALTGKSGFTKKDRDAVANSIVNIILKGVGLTPLT